MPQADPYAQYYAQRAAQAEEPIEQRALPFIPFTFTLEGLAQPIKLARS